MPAKLFSRISYLSILWHTSITTALATAPTDTVITGTNTIRVNSMGCIEPLLNILVNGFEIGGLITSAAILATIPKAWSNTKQFPMPRFVASGFFAISALTSPSVTNSLVGLARDNGLFS